MNGLWFSLADWIGIAVFALSGCLVAARKGMDPLGFAMLATATGIGGGTLRDMLLALPVFWVHDPADMIICLATALGVFFVGSFYRPLMPMLEHFRALLWLDAAGLAIFAISGAAKAEISGAHPLTTIVLGMMTACFGGIIRDVLAGERSLLFHRELYATAAFGGAATYMLLELFDLPVAITTASGLMVGFGLRGLAIVRGWALPAFAQLPGH
ncbi:trimeric intracellular cation channel family protein [Methylovirgula sp. 4M-Z18]|uniref:trimeric intracellular cation channel family protein n=1 Tax=Methylovirgula sp. 4M-Z18 TaxID=2293567 RepID=UPI001FDF6F72|nr:trimeric intracellular cation channel family protein [Methylovirgula sp. 4M-Z18]